MDYDSLVRDFCTADSDVAMFVEALNNFESKKPEPELIVENKDSGAFESVVEKFYGDSSEDVIFIEALDNFECKSSVEPLVIVENAQTGELENVMDIFYDDSEDMCCVEALDDYESKADNAMSDVITIDTERNVMSAAEVAAKACLLVDSDDKESPSNTSALIAELERDTNELLTDLNREYERVEAIREISKK